MLGFRSRWRAVSHDQSGRPGDAIDFGHMTSPRPGTNAWQSPGTLLRTRGTTTVASPDHTGARSRARMRHTSGRSAAASPRPRSKRRGERRHGWSGWARCRAAGGRRRLAAPTGRKAPARVDCLGVSSPEHARSAEGVRRVIHNHRSRSRPHPYLSSGEICPIPEHGSQRTTGIPVVRCGCVRVPWGTG